MAYVLRLHAVSIQPAHSTGRLIRAYRWQHILAGVQHEWFANALAELASEEQGARIAAALLPIAAWPEPRALAPRRSAAAGAS